MPSPSLSLLGRVAPRATALLVYPALVTPGPRLAIRPEQQPIMDDARRSTITVRGRRVAVYEWGSGADVVLLVHGWQGRAAQFAALVPELRSEGYRVVAFDAPASGESSGSTTDGGDFVAIIRELQSRHGAFAAIVGHSFGTLASLVAIREGIVTRRFAGVASIPDAEYLMASFARTLRLDDRVRDLVAARFERRRFPGETGVLARFSGVANPVSVPTLFVHDVADREVEVSASERLHAAHGDRSRLVLTEGRGHSRILAADETLDAVLEFLASEPARVRGAAL